MKIRTWQGVAVMLTLTELMPSGCGAAEEIQENKPAPSLTATLLNGERFSLAEQSGKVVIINFWATWCVPCWAEMPALEDYYRKHRAQGLEIIAISVDKAEDEAKVREVMRKFTFPAAMLKDVIAAGYGQVSRVPLTFVVSHRGILLRDGRQGKPGVDLPTLEWRVNPYLPGPPVQTKVAP